MSKQRCVLIFLILLASVTAYGMDGFNIKTSVSGISSGPKGILLQNRMGWQGSIAPGTTLLMDSDLRWSDVLLQDDLQKAWHSGSIRLDWKTAPFNISAAYRNLLFGSPARAQLFPTWDPLTEFDRNLQHQTTLKADWNNTVSLYGMHKHLRVIPYTFDFDIGQIVMGDEQGLDDLYAGIGTTWRPSRNWTLGLGADYKDGTFATGEQYEVASYRGSVQCEYPFSQNSGVSGSIVVEHRDGDFADAQRSNVLRSRVRVQHRIINDLSAVLVWENNSCFDDQFSALRLMSNYFRVQSVFNLGYDVSAGSYLLGGIKVSPENDASAMFAEAECLIGYNVYAGTGLQVIPDRQNTYTASLSRKFLKNHELSLEYNRAEDLKTDIQKDYFGLSTGFWW
jgi:hypothetical protein